MRIGGELRGGGPILVWGLSCQALDIATPRILGHRARPGRAWRCADLRGARSVWQGQRPATLYPVDRADPDHDAVMRIGGELRGGGPILNRGWIAMFGVGLPPPRIVIGSPRSKRRRPPNLVWGLSCQALDIATPAHLGTSRTAWPGLEVRRSEGSSLCSRASAPRPCIRWIARIR